MNIPIIGYRNLILQSGTNTRSIAGVILLLIGSAHAPKTFWQCLEQTCPYRHASSSHQQVWPQMWQEVKSHLLLLFETLCSPLHTSQTCEISCTIPMTSWVNIILPGYSGVVSRSSDVIPNSLPLYQSTMDHRRLNLVSFSLFLLVLYLACAC